jgi:hypothetical protein
MIPAAYVPCPSLSIFFLIETRIIRNSVLDSPALPSFDNDFRVSALQKSCDLIPFDDFSDCPAPPPRIDDSQVPALQYGSEFVSLDDFSDSPMPPLARNGSFALLKSFNDNCNLSFSNDFCKSQVPSVPRSDSLATRKGLNCFRGFVPFENFSDSSVPPFLTGGRAKGDPFLTLAYCDSTLHALSNRHFHRL